MPLLQPHIKDRRNTSIAPPASMFRLFGAYCIGKITALWISFKYRAIMLSTFRGTGSSSIVSTWAAQTVQVECHCAGSFSYHSCFQSPICGLNYETAGRAEEPDLQWLLGTSFQHGLITVASRPRADFIHIMVPPNLPFSPTLPRT